MQIYPYTGINLFPKNQKSANPKSHVFKLNSGFTLIEVLVAATIIALLSTIGLTSFQAVSRSGRDSLRKTDLESIRSALEIYKSEYGYYPITTIPCKAAMSTNYINPYPEDPQPLKYQYCYVWVTTAPLNYRLCAHMENSISPTIDPATCGGSSCGDSCNYQLVNP